MKSVALKVGVLCVVLSGTLAWQAVSHTKWVPPAAQEKYQSIEIKIDSFSFMPQDLTVAVGSKVTWISRHDIPHTVRSTEDKFKSNALDTDDAYSFT
jgi:plastocyanin